MATCFAGGPNSPATFKFPLDFCVNVSQFDASLWKFSVTYFNTSCPNFCNFYLFSFFFLSFFLSLIEEILVLEIMVALG